jgi:hypothetical protein
MIRKILLSVLLSSASLYATGDTAQTTQAVEDPWAQTNEFDGVINELHDNGAFREHEPKRYAWWQVKLMRAGATMYLYYHLCTKKVVSWFKPKKKPAKKPVAPPQTTEQ